ncbi:hypothetical protein [Streptomyces dengpaensis]|uniref:CopG family transcriptional regulator n=2 Tax=Streptomyces TaxID=1883 RepID=A0ABM6SWS1_9ACTN|nr:hypothetical protein [Streptomyces dengpaensis]AVH59056.1 hypothetical protein C4B68_28590 [Streptomyces dengpaensis]PIB05983.1 hypothetical protein B1C81_27125 [Streptomyces sp. HG99]
MPDHSLYARRLREIADALDSECEPTDDALSPHPDTLEVISNRRTKRGQLNYAVPETLQLQRRIRRFHADTGLPHGDIVALAVDTWLRAKGYPPGLSPARTTAT